MFAGEFRASPGREDALASFAFMSGVLDLKRRRGWRLWTSGAGGAPADAGEVLEFCKDGDGRWVLSPRKGFSC